MKYDVLRHRQPLALFLLALAFWFGTLSAANAQPTGQDCPPAPEPRAGAPGNGTPPIYIGRDSLSCRIFALQLGYTPERGYEPYWAEGRWSDMEALANEGITIIFNYQVLTTRPVKVLEYFNRILGHYFIVAEGDESNAVDAGHGGPGWERTGLSFTAWQLDPSLRQQISVDLCRFYGSPVLGPNSHFFTVEGPECEMLKRIAAETPHDQPKWNYEGSAFRVEPLTKGQCRPGQLQVLRLYNNGFAKGIDSNHRYTPRIDVAEAMVQSGWLLEGAAFCALP